ARTYGRFVGLTIINPTTIVYFAAVVIGLGVAKGMTAADGALFVIGAFLASLSWQVFHRRRWRVRRSPALGAISKSGDNRRKPGDPRPGHRDLAGLRHP
ncbi:MAG: hypothetical protein ACRDU7_09935, partial [Acidimicrobiia bacterium]